MSFYLQTSNKIRLAFRSYIILVRLGGDFRHIYDRRRTYGSFWPIVAGHGITILTHSVFAFFI